MDFMLNLPNPGAHKCSRVLGGPNSGRAKVLKARVPFLQKVPKFKRYFRGGTKTSNFCLEIISESMTSLTLISATRDMYGL